MLVKSPIYIKSIYMLKNLQVSSLAALLHLQQPLLCLYMQDISCRARGVLSIWKTCFLFTGKFQVFEQKLFSYVFKENVPLNKPFCFCSCFLLKLHTDNIWYTNFDAPFCSLFGFIVIHMLMYSANLYFWRRYRVNYSFIFGFKKGTELGYREVFVLS